MEAARKLGSREAPNDVASAARADATVRGGAPLRIGRDRRESERVTFAELDRSLKAGLERAGAGEASLVVTTAPAGVVEHAAVHARRRVDDVLALRARAPGARAEGGARVVFVSSSTVDAPWREAARQLLGLESAEPVDGEPSQVYAPTPKEVAELLAAASRSFDAVVVVERELSTFGRAVLETYVAQPEAEPAAGPACAVFVFTASAAPVDLARGFGADRDDVPWLELDERMEPADAAVWWETVSQAPAFAARASQLSRLAELEAWWSAAQAAPAVPVAPSLPAQASALYARLTLAARTWPEWGIPALCPEASRGAAESAVRALVDAGLAERKLGAVALTSRAMLVTPPASAEDRAIVLAALRSTFRADAVALMREAEIAAEGSSSPREVDAIALSAIRAVVDAELREDLWARYDRILATRWARFAEPGTPTPWVIPSSAELPEGSLSTLLDAGDVALQVGDVERAVQLAQQARGAALSLDVPSTHERAASKEALERRDVETLLLLGRAQFASGDLTSATLTIGRALEVTKHDPASGGRGSVAWGRAAVALAEVRYQLGELGEAHDLASAAVQVSGASPSARLGARNVIGKVLLARAKFDDADKHFAADASDAACVGDTTAELRARLNRAIALMSSSRYSEARAMLDAVRDAGEERRELRAVCFALGNLATIAVLEHRYADALDLLDRTIELLRRVGDKPRLAVFIANLAELRLRLGLDREAEQVLLFGRRVCGVSAPVVAQLSLVSARIQLAKGKTAEAFRDLSAAIAPSGLSLVTALERARGASGANPTGWTGFVGAVVAEAFRIATRAALDEGDTEKARVFLDYASADNGNGGGNARSRAEIALLRAMLARALGEPFGAVAKEALRVARDADEDDFIVEAHVLCHLSGEEGDGAGCASHRARAAELRDAVAATLPAWVRERYLARRDLLSSEDLDARETIAPAAPSARPSSIAPRPGRSPEAARSIVGSHPAMKSLLSAVRKVGASDTTVLVHGESGTGKELVADAIHEASLRRSGPLVKVNCAALVETLLLSELFGHEKGAFTGAGTRRRGRFEAAEGGTLFLDEIGDISHRTQVALLRVLQEKTFERVGGTAPLRANVRVVCATHRDLRAMVARGEFREDLYYRLCGMVLEVPALRERAADIGVIAHALLARIAEERGVAPMTLSASALFGLQQHAWPGNVRELENALRAASLFAETSELQWEDFTDNVESLRYLSDGASPATLESGALSSKGGGTRDALPASMPSQGVHKLTSASATPSAEGSSPTDVAYAHIRGGVSLADMKRQIERDCIARAMGETDGNITRAAGLLGMKRPRLSQLVKQYGLGGEAGNDEAFSESEEDEG